MIAQAVQKIPVAYAIWEYQGDFVFVSDALSSKFGTSGNNLDPYDFFLLIKEKFGNFLVDAIRAVELEHSVISKFSRDNLKLTYDRRNRIYTLVISEKDQIHKIQNENTDPDIMDSLPMLIWKNDKDSTRIKYCNKAYADALETTKDAVVRDNIQIFQKHKRRHKTNSNEHVEHLIVRGKRKLYSIKETETFGYAIDITETENLQKDLADLKKQTEDVFERISTPIAVFDKNSVLVLANDALLKLLSSEEFDVSKKYTFQEIIDYFITKESVISIDDLLQYKDSADILFRETIEPFSVTIHLQNGKTINTTVTPTPDGGLIFSFEDISDEISLKRHLNSIESVQTEIFDHLSDGVILFGSDLRIQIFNSSINSIFDKQIKLSDMHVSELFAILSDRFSDTSVAKNFVDKLINVIDIKKSITDIFELQTGKTISIKYIPLPECRHLLMVNDITSNVALSKAVSDKVNIVKEIDTLKSHLIANISNEFRSPLNTISCFSEILVNEYFGKLNQKQSEYISGILKASNRIIEIVDSTIALAELEASQMKFKFEETDVYSYIKDIVNSLKKYSELYKNNIKLELPNNPFSAFLDTFALTKALVPLISKAIRTSPSGECVSVALCRTEENPDYFDLFIQDQDKKSSKDELDAINKKLVSDQQFKFSHTSIDFGLFLANEIIRKHNGKIIVDSPESIGTRVMIRIPIMQSI